MALSLVGIDPVAQRRYSWIGDEACDIAASDYARWKETGEGLVARDGMELTVIVCEPIRPATVQGLWSIYHAPGDGAASRVSVDLDDLKRAAFPALLREFVAYGVVAIENGPALKRKAGLQGMRLTDESLALLEGQPMVHVTKTGEYHSLMSHLGGLLMNDNSVSGTEKKV